MRAVGIKLLKDKLSEYVHLAEQGETILVTDRDRVVAELSPPSASHGQGLPDALLADLVRNGLLTPALYPPGAPPATQPVAPLAKILDELAGDRSDR